MSFLNSLSVKSKVMALPIFIPNLIDSALSKWRDVQHPARYETIDKFFHWYDFSAAITFPLLLIIVQLFTPVLLRAQTSDSSEDTTFVIKEVIVTAQRQAENVQKVPISIQVFGVEQLQKSGITSLQGLTMQTPNVNIFASRSSSNTGAIFIRGIGQEDNVFTVDPGVGIYLDDIIIPRSQASLLDIYDVERVEVLRGPQGTLYGRNTSAGTIKYHSRPPTDIASTGIELTSGTLSRFDVKAVTNYPLIPGKFLSRFSFASFTQEGFEFNQYTGKRTDSKNTRAGRASLLWLLSNNSEIEFKADGMRQRPSIHVGSLIRPQTTALDYMGLLRNQLVTFPVPNDPFNVRANTEDKLGVDTWGVSGTWLLGKNEDFSVKTIASYRSLSEDGRFDFDATEARAADVFIIHHHKQWSGELQFTYDVESKWKTVGGLFFFYENDDEFDGTDALAKGFSLDAIYDQTVHSYAAYAQSRYQITENFAATLGLRYTHEIKEFNRQSELHRADSTKADYNLFGGYGNGPGGRPPSRYPGNGIPQTNIRDASANWNALTPRVGFEYSLSSDILTFASVARGFKSGGFNGRASETSNPKQREPYNPEYVWTYEAGTKTSWFQGRMLANLSLFYNDYTDLQLSSFSTNSSGQYLPLFTNAGKALTQGFELEVTMQPVERLRANGGIGYTDSKYKTYVERGRDLSNERTLPNAPRWTGFIAAAYRLPIFNTSYSIEFGGDINFQGDRFLTVSNLPDLKQSRYTIYNAFVVFKPQDEHWQITVNGKNLTDKHYLTAGLDASSPPFGIVNGFYGNPLTWSATTSVRF